MMIATDNELNSIDSLNKHQKMFVGIVAHKPISDIAIPYHHIICAGATANYSKFEDDSKSKNKILRDDYGLKQGGLSSLNHIYNELTVQYWMWKTRIEADFIGMCHYRRLFNFHNGLHNRHPRVNEAVFSRHLYNRYGWNRSAIEKIPDIIGEEGDINNADLLWAASEVDVKPGVKSIYLNHKIYGEEWTPLAIASSVKEVSPKMFECAREYFNQSDKHMFSMFIMRRDAFQEYSEWMFDVLRVYEQRLKDKYGELPPRSCAFAGEHLLNIWGNYKIKNDGLKVKELQTVFINCPDRERGLLDLCKAEGKKLFSKVFPYGTKRRDWVKWQWMMRKQIS